MFTFKYCSLTFKILRNLSTQFIKTRVAFCHRIIVDVTLSKIILQKTLCQTLIITDQYDTFINLNRINNTIKNTGLTPESFDIYCALRQMSLPSAIIFSAKSFLIGTQKIDVPRRTTVSITSPADNPIL